MEKKFWRWFFQQICERRRMVKKALTWSIVYFLRGSSLAALYPDSTHNQFDSHHQQSVFVRITMVMRDITCEEHVTCVGKLKTGQYSSILWHLTECKTKCITEYFVPWQKKSTVPYSSSSYWKRLWYSRKQK